MLTVIFTSGSTGQPKGVMLTQSNIGSNLVGIDTIIHLKRDDCMLGILPLFHAFGYTVTMWTVLTCDPQGVYHYSPLEAREIARLCKQHKATISGGHADFSAIVFAGALRAGRFAIVGNCVRRR